MPEAMQVIETLTPYNLVGQIVRVEGNELIGWAFDDSRPDEPINVGVRVAQTVIGTGVADMSQDDLRRAGYGNGCHGFRICVDVPFTSGQNVELELFDQDSGAAIAATPFVLHCRHPLFLSVQELDSHSIHGREPVNVRSRQRRFQSVVSPIFLPIRKLRKRKKTPVSLTSASGVTTKLARLDSFSVSSTVNVRLWPKLILPAFDKLDDSRPRVSIIIPVHNQFHLTYQCLSSLILSGDKANLEIIVVDDASTDATGCIESQVDNLSVIRNEDNLGFLHSCNKAASLSNGEYIVFLNNDTEVEAGWIDNMLELFGNYNDVGAVGAKLIYPDGSLQDAGGIVWNSGTPWNVGHGKGRDDPEYNYVREVDYLTGAALMVSRSAWQTVNGFSEQYAPAYYEDTDLAFKLRDAGYRTLYCPKATVVHYEGQSHGTDTTSGVKKHQLLNADHFRTTWQNHFAGLGVEGQDLRRNKDRNRGLRVLMVDNAFPRLGKDAGSYAAIQEIRLLLELGCKVTFLPDNLLHLGKHVDFLQSMGVECVYAPFVCSAASFLEHRAAEFDAVYITRYAIAEKIIPLVREHATARIIFNNADLHFLREMRSTLANGQSDMSAVERTRRRELAVMQSADVVFSYSDVELEIVATHLLCTDKLFRCPWVLTTHACDKTWQQRKGITFLGGYAHPPNTQAMDWFIDNVMPLLHRRRPELVLNVWGSDLPLDSGWDKQPGVMLRGYAASLDEVFHDSLAFVAPLQAGAGIKGKVLDSLAYSVPTVLSPVAAEATRLVDGSSTLIAHTPDEWVAHIESLLDSEALWQQIRGNSILVRDQHYSISAGKAAMQKVFDFLDLDTGIAQQRVALNG